ncbi:MAG: serine/threonine-protein kinase, partial [Planctomycetota bacterium]
MPVACEDWRNVGTRRPDDLIGKLVQGRYRVRSLLGTGGMGAVYLADDTKAGAKVCLKILKHIGNSGARSGRFLAREFRVLKALKHPNLEEVYEFGALDDQGGYFFSCEYLEGSDLYRATAEYDFDRVYDLLVQVCRALQYIHSHGLIHFDIKPENILVTGDTTGRPPLVKIIDFGLASEKKTGLGTRVRGTLEYVAPEILSGDSADHRSDLFSLGVTLYRILARTYPFPRGSNVDALVSRLSMDPGVLESPLGDVPPPLARITVRLLERSPDRRYLDANEILSEIARATRKDIPPETPETKEGRILSGRFVGRSAELERLQEKVRNGNRHGPSFVLITGDRGVGKTRLMREFGILAQVAGWRCLEGDTTGGGGGATLQPLLEIIEDLVRQLGKNHPLVERFAPDLCQVLPHWFSVARPRDPLAGEEGRIRLLDSMAEFILDCSRLTPLVVLLDNLHRADHGILDALGFLVRRERLASSSGDSTPRFVLVASTCSEIEGHAPDGGPLSSMSHRGMLEEICLPELDRDDVEKLISSMFGLWKVDEDFLSMIFESTGGNPLLVEELVKVLAAEGSIGWTGTRWTFPKANREMLPLPGTMEDLFLSRLQGMSVEEEAILEALALWGRPAHEGILDGLLPGPPSPLLYEHLLALEDRGLLENVGGKEGWGWRLRSGWIGPMIANKSTGGDRTREVHARAADLLEREGRASLDGRERIARHLLMAGDGERGVPSALSLSASLRSIHQYERALELLSEALKIVPNAAPLPKADLYV